MLLLNGVYKQRQSYAINNPTIVCDTNGFWVFSKLVKDLLKVLPFVYQDNSDISSDSRVKDAHSRRKCVYLSVIESLACTVWGNGNIGPFGQSYLLVPLLKTPCTKGMQ